jgi:uncharacterized coiled-coil DUF342 family protein
MTDHTNTYPDLVNVEDWLNAKGYTGEAGACHQAMSLIRSQEKRIEDLRKEADMMHSEYKTAAARIAELEAVFETKWDAEQRAIKAWQEKTGKDMTWPDHAKMVEWLLDELEAARAALEKK